MIRIITTEGTFDVPGTAKDLDTAGNLKIRRDGHTVAEFRRWIHWLEITDQEGNTK